ncbi:MAG: ABC transporter permease subunit [Clostridia bacterium]|nr:ABC transporter permease subunit [Clostridia bacterium]
MFNKALFKQSSKANFMRWLTITGATCLMLMVIIFVLGNINIVGIRDSLKDVFTTANDEAAIKENAVDSYDLYLTSVELEHALTGLANGNQTLAAEEEENLSTIWDTVTGYYEIELENFAEDNGREANAEEKEEIRAALAPKIIEYFKQMDLDTSSFGFDDETAQHMLVCLMRAYDGHNVKYKDSASCQEFFGEAKQIITTAYVDYCSYAAHQKATEREDSTEEFAVATAQAATAMVMQAIDSYQGDGSSATYDIATYKENGKLFVSQMLHDMAAFLAPAEYTQQQIKQFQVSVKVICRNSITTYQIWLEEGAEKDEARAQATMSISDQIPEAVQQTLTELGEMDISGLIVGSMFYKMAGILLPMVFIITTANGLLAGQVDSGSMAYVLSTPTKRRTVTVTQMIYLVVSIFVMYAALTATSMLTLAIVGANFGISMTELLLLNIGSFVTMIAIAGFCFMCSAIFNRAKHSISLGGGLSIFFLVCTILGLFGSTAMPQALRISAMDAFNYASIISLFDTTDILSGGVTFVWKLGILAAIGIVCFIIGIIKFEKKNLPL